MLPFTSVGNPVWGTEQTSYCNLIYRRRKLAIGRRKRERQNAIRTGSLLPTLFAYYLPRNYPKISYLKDRLGSVQFSCFLYSVSDFAQRRSLTISDIAENRLLFYFQRPTGNAIIRERYAAPPTFLQGALEPNRLNCP